MLISLPPVITKGEAKTTLFPWYVYPPVEPFVARMLAGTVGRTATFFLSVMDKSEVLISVNRRISSRRVKFL